MLYKKDKLLVRQLKETDKELLVKWLTDPTVLEFYEGRDRPHDLQMVNDHFYERDSQVMACIVEFDGSPIGYIQYYPIDEEEKETYGYKGALENIFGTDQFIGEASYWNKGIGKLLISSMIDYLIAAKKATRIVMDPQCWNTRAIACYEKCGLKKVKYLPKHEKHEGKLRDC